MSRKQGGKTRNERKAGWAGGVGSGDRKGAEGRVGSGDETGVEGGWAGSGVGSGDENRTEGEVERASWVGRQDTVADWSKIRVNMEPGREGG